MFVRKGTIRKSRGGSNRRSTRRPGSTTSSRKSHIFDDPSSTGSSSHRLGINGDMCATKSASANSLRLAQNGDVLSCHSAEHVDEMTGFGHHSHIIEEMKSNGEHLSKPSPARSVANTIVSFDDERQLVRTSVGWEGRHGDDLQPEYGAFLYQITEASKEADNVLDFMCKTSNILCNTIFVTVVVGMSMALPVAMVSIGVKYLDDCPKEPRIPVYLLVGGCFGMIKLLSTIWRNIQSRRYQDAEVVFDDHDADGAFASTTYRTMDTLLLLFLVGWQVAGTYWTLDIWTPHFNQLLHEPSNWCDQTVYMFSIYQIFGCYGLMAVYVLVLFLLMCCQKCCNQRF